MSALEQRIEEIRHGFHELLAVRIRIRVQHDDAGHGSQSGIDNEMGCEVLGVIEVLGAIFAFRFVCRLRKYPLPDDNIKDWIRCILVRKEGAALACGDVRRA
jgi:hypothetical protein